MGLILGVLFGFLTLGCAAIAYYAFKGKKDEKKKTGLGAFSAISAFVFFALFIFVPFGFKQVNVGEIAVVKVWGEAKEVKTEGLHFRNIITTKYEVYDVKTQDVRTTFESYTMDGQAVSVQLTTQFRIQPDKVIDIAKTYGSLDVLKQRVDIIGIVGTKEIISTYDAMTLIKERGQISTKVASNIQDQFNAFHITVTQILVTDIAFTPVFENMIEEKKLAEQQLEKAEIELKKQLAEAENKVKIAEAKAEEELAKAQGDANAILAIAEAEAQKLQKLAEAEAQALRLKSIELARSLGINIKVVNGVETIDSEDQNIDKLSSYLQYIAYLESWDGKLPEIILGDDAGVLLPIQP